MKKDVAMKWVEALRSGKYKQGEPERLKSKDGYCCLGVLIEINNCYMPNEYEDQLLKKQHVKKFGMNSYDGSFSASEYSLATLNDYGITNEEGKIERLTFDEIADIIQIAYKEL